MAVVVELLAELVLAWGGGFGGDGFFVGLLGHLAVLDAVEGLVGEIGAEGGEDAF